jgi:hypothetical protein
LAGPAAPTKQPASNATTPMAAPTRPQDLFFINTELPKFVPTMN